MTTIAPLRNSSSARMVPSQLRAVHLPFYDDNPYQSLLLNALNEINVHTTPGGGGGNFFRTALFRWKADILHFHWIHPYLLRKNEAGTVLRGGRFLAEIAALKRAGIRIVWTVHNLANHEQQHVDWEYHFTRIFARMANAIIVHDQSAQNELLERFRIVRAERISIIPHGHYINTYPNGVNRESARHALGLLSDRFVLTLFGRLRPYKGVEELLTVFGQWDEPNAILLIAGSAEPPLRDQVLQAAAVDPRIVVQPHRIAENEVQHFLNASDAVVLPYRDVLTSGSAVLAMSFGRACIAPAVGSFPELLGDRNVIYRTPSCPDLATALRNAFRRRMELDDVGRLNYERATAWSWDKIARETKQIYKHILAGTLPRSAV